MDLVVLAVGKAGRGPEAELAARYAERTAKSGRSIGVQRVTVREIADGAGAGATRTADEAARLLAARPAGILVALDEAGRSLSSEDLAARLEKWLHCGVPAAAFALGGADGHGPAVKQDADLVLSLSAMTLPHLLARVVLLEQLYRAVTILQGHPYHRA